MSHPDTDKQDEITRARARDSAARKRELNRQAFARAEEQSNPVQGVARPSTGYSERPTDKDLLSAVAQYGSGGELSQAERDRSADTQRNAYADLAAARTRDTQMRRQAMGMSRLPRDGAPPPENEWLMEYGPNSTFDRNPDAGLVPQARENAARNLSEIRLTPEQQLYNTIFGSSEEHAQMSREEANDKGAVYRVLLDAQERHKASVDQMDADDAASGQKELDDLNYANALLKAQNENAELKSASNPDPNSLEAKEESNFLNTRALNAYLDDPNTLQPSMASFTSEGNPLFGEQEGRGWRDLSVIGGTAAAGAAGGSALFPGIGTVLGGFGGALAGIAGTGKEDVDTVAEAQEWFRQDAALGENSIDDMMGGLHDQNVPWETAINHLNIQASGSGGDPEISPAIVQSIAIRWAPVFRARDQSIRQSTGEPAPDGSASRRR
jgi:hypothetical protein